MRSHEFKANGARKRIMIMPGGVFQHFAVSEAQRMGIEVLAIDRRSQAESFQVADFAEIIDPLDVDSATRAAADYGVDGVIAVAHDPSVVPSAIIAERLGLSGLPVEVATVCCNKRFARARLHELLPEYCPQYRVPSSITDAGHAASQLGFPIVLKPSDSHGGRGVIIVDGPARIEEGYRYAHDHSTEGVVIAERMLRGRELSVESITWNGCTEVIAIGDTMVSPPPFCTIVGHTMPSTLPQEILEIVRETVRNVGEAFGIDSGPTHTELFWTDEGPKVVEIGARLGGGCIPSHLVPLSTGVNLVRAAISLALGDPPETGSGDRCEGAAVRFITDPDGGDISASGFGHALEMPGVVEAAAMPATDTERVTRRIGFVVAKGSRPEEAASNAENAVSAIVPLTDTKTMDKPPYTHGKVLKH